MQIFGMDISAYVILIILGTPIYFFWRWFFRKSEPRVRKVILTWLATIIATPIFYVTVVLIFILVSEYYPNRDFEKKLWQNDKEHRYEYTHDLIQRKILIGKSKKQVLQLLGKDTDTTQTVSLEYDIGFRPELTGIDPSYLIINFKNGRVDNVEEYDK
jgi:hypothetical protein